MSITSWSERRLRWNAVTCSVTETAPKASSTPSARRLRSARLDEDLGVLLRLRVPVAVEGLDDRAASLDVELADLVGATRGAGRRRRDGRWRRRARPRRDPSSSPEVRSTTATESADAERSEILPAGKPGAAGHEALVAAPAQLAERDEALGALAPARAQHLVVSVDQPARPPERRLVGGGEQVLHLDLLRLGVEDRGLDGTLEELLGMAAEELVERVLAGDVERQAAAPPPGAAPHLAQAGDGSRERDADRRVELADVDPQLERVGRDDAEQLAARQRGLDLAPLLGRVAGAVGRDPRPRARGGRLLAASSGRSAGSARSRGGCA